MSGRTTQPKLRTFELYHFCVNNALLLDVLEAHAQTLVKAKLLKLDYAEEIGDELYELEAYLDSLELEVCEYEFP